MAKEIRGLGRRSWLGGGDLGEAATVDRLFQDYQAQMGRLDLFVGNAGIWPPEPVALRDLAPERWRETMQANLDSIFLTTRAALRMMPPGGRVVLVSSTAAQRGEAFHADYAATKGAMIALTKSLAVECAPDITVNCVAPGWVDTEMSEPAYVRRRSRPDRQDHSDGSPGDGRGSRRAHRVHAERPGPAHHGRGAERERGERVVRLNGRTGERGTAECRLPIAECRLGMGEWGNEGMREWRIGEMGEGREGGARGPDRSRSPVLRLSRSPALPFSRSPVLPVYPWTGSPPTPT